MELTIPRAGEDPLRVSLSFGEQLYVLGANGTGKSSLLLNLVKQLPMARRLSAGRQTYFSSMFDNNVGDLVSDPVLPRARTEEHWRTGAYVDDLHYETRWSEPEPSGSLSAVLLRLLASENAHARSIVAKLRTGDAQAAIQGSGESTLERLNRVLRMAHLQNTIEIGTNEDFMVVAANGNTYRLAEMSDGERSAFILSAYVLTESPNTVLVIDEPDKHLHRSIIVPLLSALFDARPDCAFIVSTYETTLPAAFPEAVTIVTRSCKWHNRKPVEWDASLISQGQGAELEEDLKVAVLGARQRILFIEGRASSLDMALYSALFPEVSVIPKGGCEEVIRAVKGLRGSHEHHHVEVAGLIDKDDRTLDQVNQLAQDHVFALDVCSVESLYYCSDAIEAVAHRQAESLGCDSQVLFEAATQGTLEVIVADTELHERMAARRSQRLAHNYLVRYLPDWKEIKTAGEQLTIGEPIENPYQDELNRFKSLVESGDLDGLTGRYPLRDSSVLDGIARATRCAHKSDYESMVVARLREDEELAGKLKDRIRPLAEWLDAGALEGTKTF